MSRVYVGGLTAETQKQELEDTFSKFGRLETVWVARQPPGFAFITFADQRDAEDACRAENGNPKGWRVEISSGGRGGGRGRGGGPSQGRYDAPPGRDDRGRDDYGRGRDSGRDYSRRSPSPRCVGSRAFLGALAPCADAPSQPAQPFPRAPPEPLP